MNPVVVAARHEAFLDLGIDIDVDFARKGRPLAVAEQHIRYKGPLRLVHRWAQINFQVWDLDHQPSTMLAQDLHLCWCFA